MYYLLVDEGGARTSGHFVPVFMSACTIAVSFYCVAEHEHGRTAPCFPDDDVTV
jgi:hypothetical protein